MLGFGCSADKSGQGFSWPTSELPVVSPSTGGVGAGISMLSTKTVALSDTTGLPGNIAFDGTRLLWMNSLSVTNCFPSSQATFQYLALDFTPQTTSTSTYVGLPSGGDCNGRDYPTFPFAAGQSGIFWPTTGTSGKISIRDNSSGTVLSTTSIDVANYGCTFNDARLGKGPLITYCGGLYYGACTSGSYLRFFAFNSSGTLQSAVTTSLNESSYNVLNALTCYAGNSLLLVTNSSSSNAYNGFYKFDFSFNLVATDTTTSYQFSNGLQQIVGIATDGTNLYLQGAVNTNVNPVTVTLGKATLGTLK